MVKSRAELVVAARTAGIPLDLEAVWRGDVPQQVKHTVESPATLFAAFVQAPEMFPSTEMLILWQTNGDSLVGFIPHEGYIKFYLEDGPERYSVLGTTYQQMLGDLLGKLVARGVNDATLSEIAKFFEFKFVEELKQHVRNDSDWEGNTAKFIEDLERAAS